MREIVRIIEMLLVLFVFGRSSVLALIEPMRCAL